MFAAATASAAGITALNLSHHLNVLKHAALIRGKKQGRFVHYSLSPGILEDALEAGLPREVFNLGCCRLEIPTVECSTSQKSKAG